MRPRRGIVGAVLVLALAGCTSDSDPDAAPSPSPSPTETESTSPSPSPSESESRPPTADAPTPPASAAKRTDQAAIDFAAYFVDVLNYSARSGETAALSRIATSSCTSCTNIRQATNRVYAADGYVRGGAWSIKSQSVFQPDQEQTRRIVTFQVATSEQVYRPSADEPEQHFAPEENTVDIYLRPKGNAWVVTRMEKS